MIIIIIYFFILINSISDLEKETLLDLALEQKDKRFAAVLLQNPKIKLSEKQFDSIFNNLNPNDFSLRERLIENKNIPLSCSQINEGLLKWDSGLNIVYAKRGDICVLKKTIDTLINETNENSCWNEDVLVELLKNHQVHFDERQVQHFLNHDNFKLKAECARNYNLNFTEEQIKNGLNDEGFERDAYDDRYDDYFSGDVVTAFLKNPKIVIPKEEVDNIIFGYNDQILDLLVKRENLNLEGYQIDAILEKKNNSSYLLLKNKDVFLNDNQLLKVLYQSKNFAKYLATEYLAREDVSVSEVVFNVLKISDIPEIKQIVEQRCESLLNTGKRLKNDK